MRYRLVTHIRQLSLFILLDHIGWFGIGFGVRLGFAFVWLFLVLVRGRLLVARLRRSLVRIGKFIRRRGRLDAGHCRGWNRDAAGPRDGHPWGESGHAGDRLTGHAGLTRHHWLA